MTNEYLYFPESKFARVNILFPLVYSDQDNNSKGAKPRGVIYQKVLSRIITSSSTEKNLMPNSLTLM